MRAARVLQREMDLITGTSCLAGFTVVSPSLVRLAKGSG